MKKSVRMICLLVVLVFTLTALFTGCGKANSGSKEEPASSQPTSQAASKSSGANAADTSKEVKIVMYFVGDKQPDADLVYAEVNKKLKQDINATIVNKHIPWADFLTKYNLIFASGEEFDCVYTGGWLGYAQQATKNAFLEIDTEMVKKYAPDYYAAVPPESWEQVKVGGKIFMLPYLHKQMVAHGLINLRGDLREKYNVPEIKTLDDLEKYLLAVSQNEKGIKAVDGNIEVLKFLMNNMHYMQPNNLTNYISEPLYFYYKMDDNSGKVVYALDDPAYLEMLKKAKKFADAGVWPKEILAQKITNDEAYTSGKSATNPTHIETTMINHNNVKTSHPDWKPEYADLNGDRIHFVSPASNGGIGIHATSKNADRVMMMMNLFATRKDYYDLTTYGIEGKHFIAVGDNKLKSTEEGLKNYVPKQNCPWGWERTEFIRYMDTLPDDLINMEKSWADKGVDSKSILAAFTFIDTNVKNELAACSNLYKTQGYILLAGLSKDPEKDLNKLKEDMKKAGVEKILAELQKQVDEFLASKK